jgi:hypothetical protein
MSLDFGVATSHSFWKKVLYSHRYIYSLIILCLILNCLLLTFFQKLWEVATPKSPSEVAECNESGFRKIWVELKLLASIYLQSHNSLSDPQLPPLDLSIPPLPITDPIWEVATPKSPSEVAECNESGFRKIWVELKQGLKQISRRYLFQPLF